MNCKEYPADWRQISRNTIAAAGNRCELCFVPNHSIIVRQKYGWISDPVIIKASIIYGAKSTKIILTVHHIDGNKRNNSKHNRIALCQRCHLRLDREKHIRNRRARRHGNQEVLSL
jgi:hypothetical protein